MFENLEEIYEALQNIFISENVSIIKKDNNIFLILSINYIGGKEQEINIELYKNSIDKEDDDIKIKNLKIKEIKNDKIILLKE